MRQVAPRGTHRASVTVKRLGSGFLLGALACVLAACAQAAASQSGATNPVTSATQDYNKAESLRINNHCDKAIPLYLRALNKNGMYVLAYEGLGYCYQVAGQPNAAILEYDKAIQIDPTNFYLYILRAGAEVGNGNNGAAEADDLTALQFAPHQVPSYVSIANSFMSFGYFADAIAALNRAIALAPDNPSLYQQRASIYLNMQQPRQAYDDYQLALKSATYSVTRANIYADLANVYSQQQSYDDAFRAIASAIAILPGNMHFYVESGDIHRDAGVYAEAIALYHHALSLGQKGPDAEAAHEGLGDVLGHMGQTKTAIAEYRLARRLTKDVNKIAGVKAKIQALQAGQ